MRLRPTVEEQLWRNELDNNNKLENKASEMLRIRTSPAPHRSAYGHRNLCNHKYIETGHILSLPHPHDLPLYIPPPPSLYSLSAWSQECLQPTPSIFIHHHQKDWILAPPFHPEKHACVIFFEIIDYFKKWGEWRNDTVRERKGEWKD